MSRRTAIVDTNVVVAGLLTIAADSPTTLVLYGMLEAKFPFAISVALLGEYSSVLYRPSLRKLHGLSKNELESILGEIAHHAIVLSPGNASPSPDPGDQLLWDLLAERRDLVLITGDKLLLGDAFFHRRVITPRAFIEGA